MNDLQRSASKTWLTVLSFAPKLDLGLFVCCSFDFHFDCSSSSPPHETAESVEISKNESSVSQTERSGSCFVGPLRRVRFFNGQSNNVKTREAWTNQSSVFDQTTRLRSFLKPLIRVDSCFQSVLSSILL
jgi:hypothetical protein